MAPTGKKKKRERIKEFLIPSQKIESSQSSSSQGQKDSINQPAAATSNDHDLQYASTRSTSSLWDIALQNIALQNISIQCREILMTYKSERDVLIKLRNLVEARQDQCVARKWKIEYRGRQLILRDLAQKTLKWIDAFKQVGDVVVSFDPVHAALPWAVIRFFLQVFKSPCATDEQ